MLLRPLLAGLIATLLIPASVNAEYLYSLTDVGNFLPIAINKKGEAAGSNINSFRGYFWSPESGLTDLGLNYFPSALNNNSVVTGSQLMIPTMSAFRWSAASSHIYSQTVPGKDCLE